MFKKGELEINWIVVAAIALVVLVIVLIAIYGFSGKFGQGINQFFSDIIGIWMTSKGG
mgnify:CR=1 FL=1